MTNSVSSIRGTLSEPEAKKIRLNGALVTGLANLPGTTELTLSGITSAFPWTATGTYDLSGDEKKIVVGILGSNQTAPFAGSSYVNDSSVFSTEDRATATRIIASNSDLGQDVLGFEYAGTGSALWAAVAYFYVGSQGGAGFVAGGTSTGAYVPPIPHGSYVAYVNGSQGNRMFQKSANDALDGTGMTTYGVSNVSYSPDGQWILYRRASDMKAYRKSASDALDGTAITSVHTTSPIYSPDGQHILYRNTLLGSLWKKSANDALDGSAITSDAVQATNASYSPDGTKILYVWMDGSSMKLFLKNANDALDGTVLTTILVTPSVNMFSPNGQYIIYRNEADGWRLWKKNTNDSSDGSAITSVAVSNMAYTLDGASIIYKNGVDGKLWKKNANDALDGVAITSFAAGFPVMSRDGTNMFYKAVSGGTLWKKSVSDALDGVQVTTSIATVPVVSP